MRGVVVLCPEGRKRAGMELVVWELVYCEQTFADSSSLTRVGGGLVKWRA